jgi:hypothetical protein
MPRRLGRAASGDGGSARISRSITSENMKLATSTV